VDGIPDFFIYEDEQTLFKRLVGFIECKKPAYPLERLLQSEQVAKYTKTCENIILTNYRRFMLVQRGAVIHDIVLSRETKAALDFANLLFAFYQYEYPYIKTKKALAAALAAQSFYYSVALREFIANKANEAESFYVKFNGLFSEYQSSINYHYELADFCDVYAQSLVYGLLLVRLETDEDLDERDLDYLKRIPLSYRLLREFLANGYASDDIPTSIRTALVNIGKNINLVNGEAIRVEFLKTRDGKADVAVYLYEDFLAEFDKLRGTENRKEGGVYYTPKDAADFIARAIHFLIKERFKLPKGYTAPNVKILDFACGTGTFLHSIFEIMLSGDLDELGKRIVKEKIIKDIYGFEILWPPYIIAHTFLTRFLESRGVRLADKERLGVYLTNTLDISLHSVSSLMPHLKQEHEKATAIKSVEDILAIVGNPPYNVNSQSNNREIIKMIQNYLPPGEANVKPLYNDYVKFIRFAQYKIDKVKSGVIGIITDHSFLDNLTYYKMREELLTHFDSIYILNLHGRTKNKGGMEGDKNIFAITQGVCISFFVKNNRVKESEIGVFYYSTEQESLFSRAEKLNFLKNSDFSAIKWTKLSPRDTKDISFIPRDLTNKETWESFMKISDIFCSPSLPIMSKKDYANKDREKWIAYQYSRLALDRLRDDFISKPANVVTDIYGITEESDWSVRGAAEDLREHFNPTEIQFRVWDNRYTSLSKSRGFLARPGYSKIGRHFLHGNLGLLFERGCHAVFRHVFITDKYADFHCVGGGSYLAPLYTYSEELKDENIGEVARTPNFTEHFANSGYLHALPAGFAPTPEEILAYIYAVLHSPVYREKYLEFLKTDFPAIPMTRDEGVFRRYAALGQALIDLHLLKDIPDDSTIKIALGGAGKEFVVKKFSFLNGKLSLETAPAMTAPVNALITFDGVPAEVYDFSIGSYKPIEKWLGYRKKDGVVLQDSDLNHIKDMFVALKGTLVLLGGIEALGEEYLTGL
jgi:type I restriction-modification system DNA methylase subunit